MDVKYILHKKNIYYIYTIKFAGGRIENSRQKCTAVSGIYGSLYEIRRGYRK